MAVFLSTLKWSLAVGAAAALLALVRPRLERRYSAKWRYWAWLFMALALLAAPLPRWAEELRPPVVIELPRVQTTVGETTGVLVQGQRPGEAPQPPLVADREIRLDDIPSREELRSAYRGRGVSVDTDTLLPLLWAVGAGLFALYHLAGTLWFGRKARRWSRPAGAETRAVFDAVAEEMGLTRVPRLAVSAAVDSPMVLGLVTPRLLLPEEENTAEELRFILRHELTHFKRRDLWYQLLLLGANALHWFNPLVYLLRRAAVADLELTCDDAVVAGAGEAERRAYSETLLRSLHRQSALGRAALSTHFYGGARVMKARFRNILSGGGRKWGGLILAAVLLLTAAAACTFGFKSREPARDLTGEERMAWEEKLNSPEWNQYAAPYGYGDIREYPPSMQLWTYLRENGWPEDWERETPPPAEELARAYPPVGTVMFVTSQQVDSFLLEHTGYTLADYPNGFGPGQWEYLEEYDGYLGRLPSEGQGVAWQRVLGGTVDGDTVTLQVERIHQAKPRSAALPRTMTLVDGKVKHYTSELETRVGALIRSAMEEELGRVTSGGAEILNRYPTGVASSDVEGYTVGDRTYTVWQCQYWAEVDDPAKVPDGLAFAAEMENWLTLHRRPVFIVSQGESGDMELEEVLPWEQWRNMDELTWEEHISALAGVGITESAPLTDAELAAWQKKLEGSEYNCFLTRFYTDVRYLPLGEIFYNYTHDTPNTALILDGLKAKFRQEHGVEPVLDWSFVTTDAANAFLEEATGYAIGDFHGGFGSVWEYHEDLDCYSDYHSDAIYTFVEVLGGSRLGDTVTLDVTLPSGNSSIYADDVKATLTIVGGKFYSFTTPLYTAAERAALDLLGRSIDSVESRGAEIVDSYLSQLWLADTVEEGGDTFLRWNLAFRMKPDDMDKVLFAGGMGEENGWVTEASSLGGPTLLFRVDRAGEIRLEEIGYVYEGSFREDQYEWEEYIACRYGLGMELSHKLDGWPERSTPFVTELLEGHSTWAMSRDGVALECLRELGKTPDADSITVLRSFDQPASGDADQGVLLQVDCEDGPATLLMFHMVEEIPAWNGTVNYWHVNSVLWPDGSSQPPLAAESGGVWEKYDYDLDGEKTADLNVYGIRRADGTAGVDHIEVLWNGGDPKGLWGGRNFFIRDAIVAEEGADSTRYYTRVWDADYGLLLEDVNFDGYTDIGVMDTESGGEVTYFVWLYDPDTDKLTETYRYAYTLVRAK